jgi:S-adenosyl-L-methionine hydrolase (adenosine-forming)
VSGGRQAIVTLLTDFGTRDGYVAEMKARVLERAREATLVDITHQVPPGDVMAAQYLLSRAWHRFPAGTVHLAVVDPGVGTDRRALAGESSGHFFVGPDNGLFSFTGEGRWVDLLEPRGNAPGLAHPGGAVSATFHGRDVFAPAAGALAAGEKLSSLGREVNEPRRAPLPAPRVVGGEWVGEVIYVDRFGTLVTNLTRAVDRDAGVRIGKVEVKPLRRTFGDVPSGDLVAFIGSGETVEIAVRDGSAAERLGVGCGARVTSTR